MKLLADIGLDNGRDALDGAGAAARRTVIARKRSANARFVVAVEPYTGEAAVEATRIEGDVLVIVMADGEERRVELGALPGLEARPDALPYRAIHGPHEPPVNSLRFFAEGVELDTISWPEETIRCHETRDDRWRCIEGEAAPVEPGGMYAVRGRYVHSYDYAQPPALKLYQYNGAGELMGWEYLVTRLGRARDRRDLDVRFTAAEGAASALPVLCTKGIGTLWVTPLTVEAVEGEQ